MSQSITKNNIKKLTCSRLPLAVYREIVAHIRQVNGVESGLLEQTAKDFDYLQSQVGGLWFEYIPSEDREKKVQAILIYYENKYGSWIKFEE